MSLFFIAGIFLFISIFFWGVTKAIEFISPLLIILSYALIIVFLLGILPATFFKPLRSSLGAYAVLMSQVLGVSTWMMSFLFVIETFGFLGIFLAFLFQFLAPIAIAGALVKSSWVLAAHLSIWILFIYAMRFYSQWLSNPGFRKGKQGDIIDVEAIEV